MASRFTIKDMREIAQLKDGKCLSKEYINNHYLLKWMCKLGHTWDTSYSIVQQGGWCMQCAKHERFDELKLYAEARAGKCISSKYTNLQTKYKWKCAKGHIWQQLFENLKKSGWCPKCKKEKEQLFRLKKLKSLVKKKGGKCLSLEYKNSDIPLIFQCRNGHTWKSSPQNIKFGYWCPTCAGNTKLTLAQFHKIAKQRGGKCLSESYKNKDTHLKFQCSQKHIWTASPRNIKNGTWCPVCARPVKSYIDKFRIENKKIKKQYFLSVKKSSQVYSHPTKGTIELMQAFAKLRGGKCLSRRYVTGRTKLKWQCDKGHTWETIPEQITAGNWCPVCGGTIKGTIEEMKTLAKSKKGKCLSTAYINQITKLKWQCVNKHQWVSTPAHILRGSWCPLCANNLRNTIEKMKSFAKTKSGKCLSSIYVNRQTKLKWKCSQGHEWEAPYVHVSRGTWCPICARSKTGLTRRVFYQYQTH
jgi:hypothetical protein